MTMSTEQSDAAILATFHSMEENIEYVLNDHWFSEMNRVRKQYNYSILKDKKDYLLSRKDQKLFMSGKEVFDLKDKTNLAFTLAFAFAFFALAFTFTFALAFQHNGIEKFVADITDNQHPIVSCFPRKFPCML